MLSASVPQELQHVCPAAAAAAAACPSDVMWGHPGCRGAWPTARTTASATTSCATCCRTRRASCGPRKWCVQIRASAVAGMLGAAWLSTLQACLLCPHVVVMGLGLLVPDTCALLQDAFPFVTHDLAMSLDGKILYGLDDPASGGAKAIRCRSCRQLLACDRPVTTSDPCTMLDLSRPADHGH